MENRISIALCTFNGSKYVGEQLKSIINQTLQPNEIIIFDDASTDNTVDIVKNILDQWDGEYKIFENKNNVGFQRNFNLALHRCSGDIIFLSDQDDYWECEKISKQVHILNENPNVLLCFHDAALVDNNLNQLGISMWKSIKFNYNEFLHGNYSRLFISPCVQGCSIALRKELLEKMVVPFSKFAYHDEWLAMNAVLYGDIYPINEKLLRYRQTGNNAIGVNIGTFWGKIHSWFSHPSKKKKTYVKNLYRKYKVWSDFYELIIKSSINENIVEHLTQYLKFMNDRYLLLYTREIKYLPSIFTYFKYYNKVSLATKYFMKDAGLSFIKY